MKRVLFAVTFVSVLAVTLFAVSLVAASQAQAQSSEHWKDVLVGPYFGAGAAVSAGNVETGTKTDYKFAWELGASSVFPLAQNISLEADLGYDSRSLDFHKQDDQNFIYNYTFNYFSIRPGITLGDFLLGVGLGIPVGYSITAQQGANQPSVTTSGGASGMDMLFEVRFGALVPLIQSDNGRLNFLFQASYAFTNLVSNGPLPYVSPSVTPSTSDNNGPLASVQLGLEYLFDVSPH